MLSMAIERCQCARKSVDFCGQGASDDPDLYDWLRPWGIQSMPLNPDTVVETWLRLARKESAQAGT